MASDDLASGIIADAVDELFSDPNIRGASGSVFRAGTDEDREDFIRWRDEGMSDHDATQKLAQRIARRWESVTEIMPEADVRTFTLMLPADATPGIWQPKSLITNSVFIYTQLSMEHGGSPPFYWAPGTAFLMLDDWTQTELDTFASFHSVSAIAALELDGDEASALIDLVNSTTIRSTVPLPKSS